MNRARTLWERYKLSKLSADIGQGAWTIVKLGCMIRCFREYGIDITLIVKAPLQATFPVVDMDEFVINECTETQTQCVGPSMLPTFNDRGDLVLTEHYSVFMQKIQPGDVVVAKSAQTPRYVVCKRVLGLEGDHLLVPPATGTDQPYATVIPKGHVWLQGDNTLNSTDSRAYGPVPYNLLQGRVFLKVWPLHEAGWVKSQPT